MIRLIEELSAKVWEFTAMPSNPFMFVGQPWKPGVYILSNSLSGTNVQVVLFGQSFLVPPGTRFRFMAHENLESFNWVGGAPQVGQEQFTAARGPAQ
jgi:hypothetical protein